MNERPHFWTGAALAILAAGPIFVVISAIELVVTSAIDRSLDYSQSVDAIFGMLFIVFLATVFGPLFAILPVLLGHSTMVWIGKRTPESRKMWIWMGVGAAIILLPAIPLGGFDSEGGYWFAPALTVTAIISAAICFRHTNWEPELAAPPEVSPSLTNALSDTSG